MEMDLKNRFLEIYKKLVRQDESSPKIQKMI